MKRFLSYWVIGLLIICQPRHHVFARDSVLQQEDVQKFVEEASVASTEDPEYVNQQTQLQQQYQQQSVEEHSFNSETWKKATEGLDYSDKRKNKPEEAKPKTPAPSAFNISEQTLRLIAFVVLFAVLILVLLKAFGVNIYLGKKKNKTEKAFSVEEFDDHLPESELDRFLREALVRNDFRLAVRIYYLMAIRDLSQRKFIQWRKEKTNFDYLSELRESTPYNGFREITFIFERVWYGELAINEQRFTELSSRFKHFLSSLKSIS